MPLDILSYPERIRYQSVPASILESDLRQYFYLTIPDQRFLLLFWKSNRLSIVLQLCIIRFMGYLPEGWMQQVAPEVIQFVAQQLKQSVKRLSTSKRPNPRWDHLLVILIIWHFDAGNHSMLPDWSPGYWSGRWNMMMGACHWLWLVRNYDRRKFFDLLLTW